MEWVRADELYAILIEEIRIQGIKKYSVDDYFGVTVNRLKRQDRVSLDSAERLLDKVDAGYRLSELEIIFMGKSRLDQLSLPQKRAIQHRFDRETKFIVNRLAADYSVSEALVKRSLKEDLRVDRDSD